MSSSRAESQHPPPYSRRRSNTAQSILRGPPAPPLRVGDTKHLTTWVHDPKDSQNVIFNQSYWPGVVEGDMLRVSVPGTEKSSGFLMNVLKADESSLKHPSLQISIPRPVAERFGVRNNGEVVLTKVDREECSANHIEFVFQDQYLSRNDMWRLGKSLQDKCVYVDQEVTFIGAVAAKVHSIYIDGTKVPAACVTSTTKAIYRSLSAKVTIFIQVCRELWEFAGDGERYNEKIVHSFLPALFARWRDLNTNHIVTIVLISRVYYDASETDFAAGPLRKDDDLRWYKDFYKVITDLEVVYDWKPTLVSLKDSFTAFQRDILLTHHYHSTSATSLDKSLVGPPEQVRLVGKISFAQDGPILEAINLALNPTETHYIDRSLSLTGASTILITPGTGFFRVSKQLLRLTTIRMLDQGFGLDLVSLAKPPLHQSPIFSFKASEPEAAMDGTCRSAPRSMDPLWGGDEAHAGARDKLFWWEPFWMSVSFWDKQMDLPIREDRFVARAKMYEIQMLGLLDSDVLASIEVPFIADRRTDALPLSSAQSSLESSTDLNTITRQEADQFDTDIFAPKKESHLATVSRNSVASSVGTVIGPPTRQHDKRGPAVSQRLANVPSRIQPIEESPQPRFRDLSSDDPIHEADSRLMVPSTGVLSTSPSSSIRSTQSNLSILSNDSASTISSSVVPNRQSVTTGSTKSVLSSKFAPSWLFNAFRSGPSQPQTSPVSASSVTSPTSTPVVAPARTSRASIPGLPRTSRTESPKPMAIRHRTSTQSMHGRNYDEDTPAVRHRISSTPKNTPPRDDAFFGKRRSTTMSSLTTVAFSSSSPGSRTNPLKPRASVSHTASSLARRWEDLYPRPMRKHDIKWKSMVTPGCLPLTTSHFPSASELETSYDVFTYEFVVDPKELRSFMVKPPDMSESPDVQRLAWALVIMRAMAAVRLAQGFQFVLQPKRATDDVEDRAALRRSKSFITEERDVPRPQGASEALISADTPVFLSMSNEIHRISCTGEVIQVQRYIRRLTSVNPFGYKCLIWPKLGSGYTPHATNFKNHGLEQYGWNRLDMLVAGYEPEFNDSLRYWRTRFVVIPTADPPHPHLAPSGERLNDEEIRLMGMDKLAEIFTRLRWRTPEEKPDSVPPVRFLPTDLGPTACVLDENLIAQLNEIHAAGPLKKKVKSDKDINDMPLASVAKAMREDGGVPIKDRTWHGNRYSSAFTGSDFVSWLLREFRDVSTREQAVEIGAKLQEEGLFVHCRGTHGFLDGHYFYQLKGEYSVPMTPKGSWFGRPSRHTPSDNSSTQSGHYPSSVAKLNPRKNKKTLIVTQSMTIDVDPNKKSDQAESVVLHYDIIHNPSTCFHFELHWIGTSARCIEDVLRQWSRTIEKFGLKLVEAYVTQIGDVWKRNPFQSCFPMCLAVPSPVVPDLEQRVPEGTQTAYYFEYQLLKKFEFVLDIEAAHLYPEPVNVVYSYRHSPFQHSQFVHRSGAAFVQILGGTEGLLFLTNRLMGPGRMGTTLKSKEQKPAALAEELRVKMAEFCSNADALTKFYNEELAMLGHTIVPDEPPPLNI